MSSKALWPAIQAMLHLEPETLSRKLLLESTLENWIQKLLFWVPNSHCRFEFSPHFLTPLRLIPRITHFALQFFLITNFPSPGPSADSHNNLTSATDPAIPRHPFMSQQLSLIAQELARFPVNIVASLTGREPPGPTLQCFRWREEREPISEFAAPNPLWGQSVPKSQLLLACAVVFTEFEHNLGPIWTTLYSNSGIYPSSQALQTLSSLS